MLPYTGNGAYCYANSLHMSLFGAGAPSHDVPPPGFLECLTTMPFGNMYLALESGPLAFFSGPTIDPDSGVTRALAALGWTCQEQSGGNEEEALARLRQAALQAPMLVGPIDLGYLSYNPIHNLLAGEDHFVVVLAVERDHILLHDPQGYPCAALPIPEFLLAWKAERIAYCKAPYTSRTGFRQIEQVSRQEMIARTLPLIKENLLANPGGPVEYGGVQALQLLARALRGEVSEALAGHLRHFALPLAARRSLDAAAFMQEASKQEAAACLQQQALLFGIAQYEAVHHHWTTVADSIEHIARIEGELVASL